MEESFNPAELVQGSPEWHKARLGMVTSSRLGEIMTKAKSGDGLSQTALSYMAELIGEKLSGVPSEELNNKYVNWGHEREPTARQLYQWHHGGDPTLKQVGFVKHPTIEGVGGSPDCLVDDDGVLEIKCPYTVVKHVNTIEENAIVDKNYQWQCQGNLWVTGRKWLDFISFHPMMPPELQLHVVRVERNDDMIEDLEHAVTRFLDQMNIRIAKIRKAVDLV